MTKPYLTAGKKIYPLDEKVNENCGVLIKQAFGYITFVSDDQVSFYLQKSLNQGIGYIEASCPVNLFGLYFDAVDSIHKGYISNKHFSKKYPQDFTKC